MDLFEDTYKTIAAPSEGIFTDKGSKFIAYAYPFAREEKLKDLLAEIKALHPKARHYCFAYRLTTDRSVFRINDDGEPSGTGGRPILNALLSKDLTNILVVVVRYFGGTLLGVPGLIHAYKSATIEALEAAEMVDKTVNDIYSIRFDYLQMNDVMRLIKEEHLEVLMQHFDNQCLIEVEIRQAHVNRIMGKVNGLDGVTAVFLYTN